MSGLQTANLIALTTTQAMLAERLRGPVRTDHVVITDAGAQYRVHRSRFSLGLDAGQVAAALDPANTIEPEGPAELIFIFGVGLGELVVAALARWPAATIIAWDRDPLMLRLMLQRTDLGEALRGGRLRLQLGADPVTEPPEARARWVTHPLLRQIYWREHAFLRDDARPSALICAGALFVDDLSRELLERGWRVWTWDLTGVGRDELARTLRVVAPELVVAINTTHGLPEMCAEHRVPLLIWEIDPAVDRLRPLRAGAEWTWVYTWRKANIARYQSAGASQVAHLPLATRPSTRHPLAPSPDEQARFGADICFVGNSLVGQVERFRSLLMRDLVRYLRACNRPIGDAAQVVSDVLAAQRTDFSTYRVPELLETRCPGLDTFTRNRGVEHRPDALLGELAAAEKRLSIIAGLIGEGVAVWGDPGWRILGDQGLDYRGLAGHNRELTLIYNAGLIHLDIGRIYQPDIVTMRVFDVLACGGFVLAEHSPGLAELLEPGVEVETWRTAEELHRKVVFYRANPEAARAIAARGRARVLAEHTVGHRLEHMLAGMAAGRQEEE